ncbi:MAG: hypothetical protein RLZZ65_257 [Bacteroidota bacterium]|jgi:glycosyltransferase involved in cell wall biosynthesis
MKKISVILSTYNSEKVIAETLKCIFNQEGLNDLFTMEVIIADDCSTDHTRAICEKFPVVFLTNDINSGGPNKGRNKGLNYASGDFICLCDHDDHWSPNKLKVQLAVSEFAPIISGGYKIIDLISGKEIIRTQQIASPYLYKENQTFLKLLSRSSAGQIVYLSGLMFAAELKTILFEEEFGFLDYNWFVSLFENQKSIQVPDILFTRFVADNNLSLNEKYRLKDHEVALKLLNQYKEIYPTESALGISKFNGTLARYYYLSGDMKKARKLFFTAGFSLKHFFFYFTSFFGHRLVIRFFHFFG